MPTLDYLGEDIQIKVKKKPYRHIVIDNVFKRDVYAKMCKAFNVRLDRGLVTSSEPGKFWKFSHYDAYCYSVSPEDDAVWGNVVYSPEWRKFINGFFQHTLTKDVLAELHHHKTGSESGYIHDDYDVASFVDEPLPNGTNPHRHQIKYRGRVPDAEHCVRSIAVIYYFNNHKWYSDFGGETAIYTGYEDGSEPVKKISPVSNRLLAFEVSPDSLHGFLCNRMAVRNSLVMWFHCPEKWATERYKEKPK